MRDSYHGNRVLPALAYAELHDDELGETIDLRYFSSCLIVFHVDTVQNVGPSHYFTLSLHHADHADWSDEAEVTAETGLLGDVLVLDSTDYAQTTVSQGYVGGKRYLRVHVDEIAISGTANVAVSAIAVLDHGNPEPLNVDGFA